MNDSHRDILREHRTYLIKEIDEEHLTKIIGYLFNQNIILSTQKEIIDSKETKSGKCSEFLNILPKRGKKAFRIFIEALNEVGLSNVATKLTDANEADDANYSTLECESIVKDAIDHSELVTPSQEVGHSYKAFVVTIGDESDISDLNDLRHLFNRANYKVFPSFDSQFPENEIGIVLLLGTQIDKDVVECQLNERFVGKKALIFTTAETDYINIAGCYIFNALNADQIVNKLKTFFSSQRVNFDVRDMIKKLGLSGTNNIQGEYFRLEWQLH